MNMNTKVIVGGVVVVILIIGAMYLMSKHTAAPATTTDQTNQQASAATATTSPQVQGQDVAIGTGATANVGDLVSVLYVGKLTDGTVFDSSAAHNNQPLVFDLGTTTLMAGFQIGINGMKVGGERLLSIPPELGYGAQEIKDPKTGKVIIPANSTLTFDVKLVGVQPAAAAPAAH
jgi:FKBP-type peptidyl-prolyl cis-trans isomerase